MNYKLIYYDHEMMLNTLLDVSEKTEVSLGRLKKMDLSKLTKISKTCKVKRVYSKNA